MRPERTRKPGIVQGEALAVQTCLRDVAQNIRMLTIAWLRLSLAQTGIGFCPGARVHQLLDRIQAVALLFSHLQGCQGSLDSRLVVAQISLAARERGQDVRIIRVLGYQAVQELKGSLCTL